MPFPFTDLHSYVYDSGNEWGQCLRCRKPRRVVVHWSAEEIETYNQLERNGFICDNRTANFPHRKEYDTDD